MFINNESRKSLSDGTFLQRKFRLRPMFEPASLKARTADARLPQKGQHTQEILRFLTAITTDASIFGIDQSIVGIRVKLMRFKADNRLVWIPLSFARSLDSVCAKSSLSNRRF